MKQKKITAGELDKIFDEGKDDVLQYEDLSSMLLSQSKRRPV